MVKSPHFLAAGYVDPGSERAGMHALAAETAEGRRAHQSQPLGYLGWDDRGDSGYLMEMQQEYNPIGIYIRFINIYIHTHTYIYIYIHIYINIHDISWRYHIHSQLDRWVRWQLGYDMGIVYAVGQNFMTLVQMDGLGIWFGLGHGVFYRGFPTLLRGNSHSHELLTFGFYASTCLPIGSLVVCDIAVMLVKPCLHIHQLWFPLNIPYIYKEYALYCII